MAQLLLVRHGQASFMQDNYDQLSKLGEEQSRLLGSFFVDRKISFHKTISGKLKRQIDTHNISLAESSRVPDIISDNFNEHQGPSVFKENFDRILQGDTTLRDEFTAKGAHDPAVRRKLVKSFYMMHHDWVKDKIPSGDYEAWVDFRVRIEQGVKEIRQVLDDHSSVALFSSGGVIATIVGNILGLEDHRIVDLNWQIKNTAISTLKYSKGAFTLHDFNMTPHLRESQVSYV